MADPMDAGTVPGFEPVMNGYTTATKSLQSFATEMQTMSKVQVEQATQMMKKLHSAKSLEDVVQLQTSFMQQSFSQYADYTRRFSELMMAIPLELAKQGQAVFQQGAGTVKNTPDETGEPIGDATRAG